MSNKLWAVVPAAGVGKRVGGPTPKQYLPLYGKAIIEWTLERLLSMPELNDVVVAISESDEYWSSLSISKHELPDDFQNCKRQQKCMFGKLPLLWKKTKHRCSLLSSTL